jgi:3-methyladenine DNA glycosylase/8-oxoguanine DNA glycosylase
VPGAWSPFEVGVTALLPPADLEAVLSLGDLVPGLPGGLTRTFPDPREVKEETLTAAGLSPALAAAVASLAEGVLDGSIGYGAPLSGVSPELRERLAFRLGHRNAFPLNDPSLTAALADLGVEITAPPQPWRPWLALAAVHLMAHGDRVCV